MTTTYATYENGTLTLGNGLIERVFVVDGEGRLFAKRVFDKVARREWVAKPSAIAALLPSGAWEAARDYAFEATFGRHGAVCEESLRVTLTSGSVAYAFEIFEKSASVTQRLVRGPLAEAGAIEQMHASGIETGAWPKLDPATLRDVVDAFVIQPLHLNLTAVELCDQTDLHDNLVFEREYLLHPAAEPLITLRGNLFVFEDRMTGDGFMLLKEAPLPHARPQQTAIDLRVQWDLVLLLGHGADAQVASGYAMTLLTYSGGVTGRTAALHQYQRCLRRYETPRDGRFVSNTWGDRNKDGRLSESFMLQEVAAGAKLGVDVVQIDDGWQRGVTSNSVKAQQAGGVWSGFWAADSNFWTHHAERFPRGVEPVIAAARERGMHFGLWFAPDSSHDFANFERDAEQILKLHREKGVNYIKIDGVKAHSRLGEMRLRKFFDLVLEGSKGAVVFDLDVTAEVRPGYWGMMHAGPIFLENRYSDWQRYWPHATLKNLWELSWYVDPARLRMEFLNNARNGEKYGEDPLAPGAYGADYLFASIMLASPLGWFEVSNLPGEFVGKVAPLVAKWREHRAAMHTGWTVPIGERPDGTKFTGFATRCADGRSGYVLIFREVTKGVEGTLALPEWAKGAARVEILGGEGTVVLGDGCARVRMCEPRSFVWAKLIFG